MTTTDIEPVRHHARDLTDEERANWREWAHQVEARVINAIQNVKENYWLMAEALYEFEDDGGWKALGLGSLNDWLGQPEIGLTRTMYYDAVGAWKALVVERKIKPSRVRVLEPTKVAIVLPAIKRGDKITTEALDDAEALSKSDLIDEYRAPKPKHADEPVSDRSDTSTTIVDTPGVTGDQIADGKVASNGGPPSGQEDPDEYIRDRTQVLSVQDAREKGLFESTESPSEGQEPDTASVQGEVVDGPETAAHEAVDPVPPMPLDSAVLELETACASGQGYPMVDRRALATVLDQLNDVPLLDPRVEAIEQLLSAFDALPERARTKHLPKPVREAIIALSDAHRR